jgi:L-lactate dehydrogenase complex protein LldG
MQTFKTSKARENILRKIRIALHEESVALPYPEVENHPSSSFFAVQTDGTLEESFAAQFSKSGGHFVFCNTQADLLKNISLLAESRGWTEVLCAHKPLFSFLVNNKLSFVREFNPAHEMAQACITDCEVAVARTGSFLFSSRQNHGRVAPVYFPVHIIVVQPHQVVADIADALKLLKQKYNGQLPSMVNLNTGPSRTADIEKTLVTGVHGPKEVFCFFLNQ